MISVLCENGITQVNASGKGGLLLEEGCNVILSLINALGKDHNPERKRAIGITILAGATGTFMQEQIDGKHDPEKAEPYIESVAKSISTNIELNEDEDKFKKLVLGLLGFDPDEVEPEADEPEPAEPAQEVPAEGGCDNEQSV